MQTHSARRINYLAQKIGAQSYLEVGVQRGRTFVDIDIPVKVAVDPKFLFDTAKHARAGTHFLEITSDEFFLTPQPDPQMQSFDIIFLDGLHTFEQTFRDFCNSISRSHHGTLWIIDDTIPSDAFSALPNQADTIRARRQLGVEGSSWHGDVYKVIFAIHDFFPCFSYCTAQSDGNPQTFVWLEPRAGFQPKFNSLETISRLSYFDFLKAFATMNTMEEPEALARVLRNRSAHRNASASAG